MILPYWPNPTNTHFDATKILTVLDKHEGTGNYATAADLASEAYILGQIRGEPPFFDHGIIAEESGSTNGKAPWQWCIDPIDGTINFRNGLPDFGILIGVLTKAKPTIGVLAMPAYQQYIHARKGHGAFLASFDGKTKVDLTKIPHLQTQPLDKILVGFDVGYEQRGEQYRKLARITDRVEYTVSYASAAAATYRLALSGLGAFIVPRAFAKCWDIAPASVIIPEIGGVISDIHGNPIDWSQSSFSFLAARTPEIHEQLLTMLKD